MALRSVKSLLVAAFSLLLLTFSNVAFAYQNPKNEHNATENHAEKSEIDFEPGKVIMEHIMDNHDFHFFDYNGHAPLPVIVYQKEKGFSFFMSSRFEHGHAAYDGYKLEEGVIKAVNTDGSVNEEAKVYDFSMTRNVVQMLIALTLLVVLLLNVAKKYKQQGAKKAPSGFQNAIEAISMKNICLIYLQFSSLY
jgi:F-type H+-transporting ATPase subunit a